MEDTEMKSRGQPTTYKCNLTRTHTHTHIHMHTQTHTYIHTHTHSHTHIHTHTHSHTHTHTHTHTHPNKKDEQSKNSVSVCKESHLWSQTKHVQSHDGWIARFHYQPCKARPHQKKSRSEVPFSIKIISKSFFLPLKEPILQDDLAQNLLGVTLDIKSYCVGV